MLKFTLLWKPGEPLVARDGFWRLHAGADIHVGVEKIVADVGGDALLRSLYKKELLAQL